MKQISIESPAVVTAVSGQVSVIDQKGNVRGVIPGDPIYPGELVFTASDSQLEFKYFDVKQAISEGCLTCIPLSKDAGDLHVSKVDIKALQRAIAKGMDPSSIAKAAAAGHEMGSSDGAVLIERNGESVLAQGGFDSAATRFDELPPFPEYEPHPADVGIDHVTVFEDGTIQSVDVLANDGLIVPGDLTVTEISAEHGEVTINPDGTISYTPNDNFNGQDTIHYKVENDQGITSEGEVIVDVVPVNDLPVAQDAAAEAIEGGAVISGQIEASDIDGDVLTFSLVDEAPEGFVLNSDGSYEFDPTVAEYDSLADGETQTLTVQINVSDGEGGSCQSQLVITVTGTNDQPVANSYQDYALEDGDTIYGQVPAGTDIDSDGVDAEGYQLVETVSEGLLVFNSDGSYSFSTNGDFQDLATDETRDVTFTYTVSDASGAVSEPAVVTITVTGSNDAPVAYASYDYAIEDGETISGQVPAATDTDSDGIDADGYQLVSDVAEGSLQFNADGSYSFSTNGQFQDLAEGETREVTFTYLATDLAGGESAPATVTIEVTGTNDAPVASEVNLSLDLSQASAASGEFVAEDVDSTDTLTYEIVSQTEAGEVINNGDGTFSFAAGNLFESLKEGETATLEFEYLARDDSGADNDTSSVVKGTITLSGGNNPVEPGDGELVDQITAEGEDFSYTIPDDAFVDPEGETITYSATLADGSDLPDWLSFDSTTGTFSGTPAESDIGSLALTVTATDPYGAGISADFEVTVLDAVESVGGALSRDSADEVYELLNDTDLTMNIKVVGDDGSSYHNSYGYYFVDAEGNPISGQILVTDSKTLPTNAGSESQEINLTIASEDIPEGAVSVGFFLVPNGYSSGYSPDSDDTDDVNYKGNPDNINNPAYQDGAAITFDYNEDSGLYEGYVGGVLVTSDVPADDDIPASSLPLVFTQASLTPGVDQEVNGSDGEYVLGDRPGIDNVNDLYANYSLEQEYTVDGSDANEWLRGCSEDEIFSAGGGDDILVGGGGEDLFVWDSNDLSSSAASQTDTILDFDLADNAIDISELLVGDTTDTLDQYLQFEVQSVEVDGAVRTDTLIQISQDGDGDTDLTIVLNGVDLAAEYGSSQADILSGLMENNKLLVD